VTPPPASPPVAERDAYRPAAGDALPPDATWAPDVQPAPERDAPGARPGPRAARSGAWQRVRTVLFWLHLAAGVAAGAVILAMSATGVALAYQRQATEWTLAGQLSGAPGARLPLDTLFARAAAAAPAGARAGALTVRSAPGTPVSVAVEGGGPGAPRRTLWLDPATGAVLAGSPRLQAFFAANERLHRSLTVGSGPRSPRGTAITGASNLAFLFLLVSGLYLWVPRRWTRRAVRAVALPARGARGRARDWNWHHVMGLWAAPGLVVVAGSAAFLSYEWPERLVARAAGVPPRAEAARGTRPAGAMPARAAGAEPAARPALASLDTLAARALGAAGAVGTADWYSVQLRPPAPDAPKFEVAATVSTARALRPDRRATVTLDAATAAVVKRQGYADLDAGRRARGWARFLHTGEAFGVAGQTVAMLVSLAGAGLVMTGLALTLRRLRRALAAR
jgi:uncharacterized iron-regulated membrane protein